MIGYDFDKTIYNGDSSTDFFFFMLKKRPYLIFLVPYFLVVFALCGLRVLSKKRMKELLFFFVPKQKNIDRLVDEFWMTHANKIKDWYCKQKTGSDLIASASLEFILMPMINALGIKNVIATKYDTKTGKISGENCYGSTKVKYFNEQFKGEKLEAFYSDSMSDLPMMQIADEAFLVRGNSIKKLEIDKQV